MKNVQIYPAKLLLVPNFKLAKNIRNHDDNEYHKLLDGIKGGVIEKKNHGKVRLDVVTTYKISNADDYDDSDPLSEFDRAVLSVCAANFEIGNKDVSIGILYRGLTGKTGSDSKPYTNQYAAIKSSIQKLMSTIIEINDTETIQAFGYGNRTTGLVGSAILPAHYVESSTLNGQDILTVHFDRESPLMIIAKERKQILTFDSELFNVPHQQNTVMNITLKFYVMCRVQEIKLHRRSLRPILTINDIFEKARILNAHNQIKSNARDTVTGFLEHLKSQGVFKDYEPILNGKRLHGFQLSF